MKCDVCNCEESVVKEHMHKYEIKGKSINFISNRRFCASCGNLVYDEVLDNKALDTAIYTYNKLYGIDGNKIVELRKKFNLSQDLFSKIIGCAKKTLISYEKGKSIPNDTYLIIIKTLIDNSNVILDLIESSKEHFTIKEYQKIHDNITLLKDKENNENALTEFNGYTCFSKEKLYNMILFYSKESVLKTKLLKELFYTDFLYYKSNGKSITGLTYAKLPFGPVPNQFETLLNDCSKEGIINYEIMYKNQYECHVISSNKNFNKNIFNKDELNLINNINNFFKNYTSKEIVEFSHKESGFINTNYNDLISYDFAFDIKDI